MLKDELRYRARRLLSGNHRIDDLDRLFLGLRERANASPCVREIGDFIAHRDKREKGLVTQVGRDVFTSVDVWSLRMRGLAISWVDIERAAYANLRLATDEQLLNGCGCNRSSAKQRLKRSLAKIERGAIPTEKEKKTLEYLGSRFIWKPAFTGRQLADDFQKLLLRSGVLQGSDEIIPPKSRSFLILYALTIMHNSAIILENGKKARLFAGCANTQRHLEVKVEIIFDELAKPLMTPICLFLTDLISEDHCAPSLITRSDQALYADWDFPIEIGSDGRLKRIG